MAPLMSRGILEVATSYCFLCMLDYHCMSSVGMFPSGRLSGGL